MNNVFLDGVRIAAVVPTGQARWFMTDHGSTELTASVDSVNVVTNDNGDAISAIDYLPYGETWYQEGDTGFSPKYNSQELDKESGLYFFNARHYDPEIARFETADSVVDGEHSVVGWNRYTYVHGNPIMYKDPTGHAAVGRYKAPATRYKHTGSCTFLGCGGNRPKPADPAIAHEAKRQKYISTSPKEAQALRGELDQNLSKLAIGEKIISPIKEGRGHIWSHWGEKSEGHPHKGIDIGARAGEPVHAAYSGELLTYGIEDEGYPLGNYVILQHEGVQTLYGHIESLSPELMKKIANRKGKETITIKHGDVLGGVGGTGANGRLHLHFEVGEKVNDFDRLNKQIDPEDLFFRDTGRELQHYLDWRNLPKK